MFAVPTHTRLLCVLLLGSVLLAGCRDDGAMLTVRSEATLDEDVVAVPAVAEEALRVGFDRRLDLATDVRQVASLFAAVEEDSSLRFVTVPAAAGDATAARVCAGEVDVGVAGTLAYLQAREGCGATMLVRGVETDGTSTYRAAIITRPGSGIETLEDVAGGRFAFGNPTSTQGHLIPREMLREVGVEPERLAATVHASSHSDAAEMVRSGVVDAAAVQDRLAADLAARGLVDIVAYSRPHPTSGVIIGPAVPASTRAQLRAALLRLEPSELSGALHEWQRSEAPGGFVVADDADYDQLRASAAAVGLLELP